MVDTVYKRTLARNRVLPAAVADPIFSKVVPHATGGRAWVKMVVPNPRNPNNRGDAAALALLEEIRKNGSRAERHVGGAYYYGEAIKAKQGCMACHGEPKGESDPASPEYSKDGWKVGDIIGAVIARVEPRSDPELGGGTN
jgi:methyl-accepting chemotaxis protein